MEHGYQTSQPVERLTIQIGFTRTVRLSLESSGSTGQRQWVCTYAKRRKHIHPRSAELGL